MNTCKKCEKEFEPVKGLVSYCSLKCRNSRVWTDEDKQKKSKSAKKSDKVKIANKITRNYSKGEQHIQALSLAWNEERKEKYSKRMMGNLVLEETKKKLSEANKGKNSGEKNGMFGKAPEFKKIEYFYSEKNKKNIPCRSSYEVKACRLFEGTSTITHYEYEAMRVPYIHEEKNRTTIPDYILYYEDGHKAIVEVKPKKMLTVWNNETKIKAIEKYCNENDYTFILMTEKQLG